MARKRKPRPRRPPPPAAPAAPERPASRRRLPDERPPAPWGSLPLVELAVLAALIMLVAGFAAGERAIVFVGLALGSFAGLELSVREHFSGYRSHTLLLSGGVAIAVLLLLAAFLPALWLPAAFAISAAAAGVAAWALVRAFQRRSGVSVKFR
jgi:hypothetical protein